MKHIETINDIKTKVKLLSVIITTDMHIHLAFFLCSCETVITRSPPQQMLLLLLYNTLLLLLCFGISLIILFHPYCRTQSVELSIQNLCQHNYT
jgi:hypothetical protein